MTLSDSDLRVLDKLKGFIPGKIFDAHAHLYNTDYMPVIGASGSIFNECGPVADRESYLRMQCPLYPGVTELRLNLVSAPDPSMKDPTKGHRALSLGFLTNHLDRFPEDIGEAFVLPGDSDLDVENLLVHPNIRGFKCYHVTAPVSNTMQADIDQYLPESAWRVANEKGLCITLHMVKDAASADPRNIDTIRDKAKKYPGVKLILAHAARGFASWTALEGIKKLSGFPNIFYDVSAVCEPTAMIAAIKGGGADKVLWGSDFPVSMSRGKCVSLGAFFLWLDLTALKKLGVPAAAEANLVGIESLHALFQACDILDLTRKDVEGIFYNNAMKLFALSD